MGIAQGLPFHRTPLSLFQVIRAMIPLGCWMCDCWWSSKYLLTHRPPFLIILADNLSITFPRHFRKQCLACSKSAPDLSWGWEQADSSATNLSSFKHLGKLEINHVQTRPVSQAHFHVLWEAGEVRVLGSAVTNFSRLKWYSILLCCFSWRGKCIGNYHRKPRRGKHNRKGVQDGTILWDKAGNVLPGSSWAASFPWGFTQPG